MTITVISNGLTRTYDDIAVNSTIEDLVDYLSETDVFETINDTDDFNFFLSGELIPTTCSLRHGDTITIERKAPMSKA